jgi:hypothetical protein
MGRAPSFLVVGVVFFSRVVSTFERRPYALGNARLTFPGTLTAADPPLVRWGKHGRKSAMTASLFANSVVVFVRRLSVWVEHPEFRVVLPDVQVVLPNIRGVRPVFRSGRPCLLVGRLGSGRLLPRAVAPGEGAMDRSEHAALLAKSHGDRCEDVALLGQRGWPRSVRVGMPCERTVLPCEQPALRHEPGLLPREQAVLPSEQAVLRPVLSFGDRQGTSESPWGSGRAGVGLGVHGRSRGLGACGSRQTGANAGERLSARHYVESGAVSTVSRCPVIVSHCLAGKNAVSRDCPALPRAVSQGNSRASVPSRSALRDTIRWRCPTRPRGSR